MDTTTTPVTPPAANVGAAEAPLQHEACAPAQPETSAQQPELQPELQPAPTTSALPPLGLWEMLETRTAEAASDSAGASARVLAHRRRSIWDR